MANEKMKTGWIALLGFYLIFMGFGYRFNEGFNQLENIKPQFYLNYTADKQEDYSKKILDILWCESRFDHSRVNPSGATGIAQFKIGTFNWLKEKADMPNLNIKNAEDQIILLDWALRNGYGNHWDCYAKTR